MMRKRGYTVLVVLTCVALLPGCRSQGEGIQYTYREGSYSGEHVVITSRLSLLPHRVTYCSD